MQPDHYETLGAPPSATPDEIKKRYRSLARRYHPDVNPNPEAAQKIKTINEAYHVLGDADRRAVYDAERLLHSVATPTRPRPKPAPNATRPPASPPSQPTARPAQPSSARKREYNGFGTVATGRAGNGSAPSKPAPPHRSADDFRAADRLIMEAQLAFINRQYAQAEDLCRQVLTIDRSSAVAHEILGDVFLKRGKPDNAMTAYTFAAQFNPRNLNVQTKLERLTTGRRHAPSRPGPTIAHPISASPLDRLAESESRDAVFGAISSILTLLFVGLCFLLWMHPGHPFQESIGWISAFSFNLLATLGIGGAVAGVILALNGKMRPITEELLARGTIHGDDNAPIHLGAVLTGFAFLWFYASFLVYLGIGLARNRLSLSVLRVYGLSFLLLILFAFLYQPEGTSDSWWQTLLFGGSILFPAMLFGWAVGDAVRLRGR